MAVQEISALPCGNAFFVFVVMHSAEDSKARFKPEILSVCTQLGGRVRDILEMGEFPLILGGDHSIAMGSVSGAAAYFRAYAQDLGLIWFDAHGDMNIPGVSSPSGNIHGMPLAHLLGRGDPELASILGFTPKLNPDKVALIGIRDIDAGERDIIHESGIHVFTMRDIDEQSMAKVARKAMEIVTDNTGSFHVSFDVDGCDPSVIPGSGTWCLAGYAFAKPICCWNIAPTLAT